MGYAMFLDEGAFNAVHQEMGEVCDYQALRGEIADACFNGNFDFSPSDAVEQGEAMGFDGADASPGDGGGDGGGGGE